MKLIRALLLAGLIVLSLTVPSGAAPLASAARPEPGLPPDWRADHPLVSHTFSNMGPRSLAIDADNHLYLAYGSDHLYYTHNDGAGWTAPEVVDPDLGVGQGVSLALDSAKKVHISYVDTAQGGLRYATNKSGAWVVTTLQTTGDIDPHTALALDTSGRPHILYHIPSVDSLGYFYLQDNGTWNGYGINLPGEGGAEVALAIGTDNVLHASFYTKTTSLGGQGCLTYQARTAGGWQAAVQIICYPLSDGGAGSTSAIAVDLQNYPHIAFNENNNLGYTYLYLFNGIPTWSAPHITSAGNLTALSIVMDISGRAHISYRGNDYLKYIIDNAGTWDFSALVVDNAPDVGQYNSLVLDSGGLPHITYFKPSTGSLVSSALTTSWPLVPETIDTLGSEVGRCTSLAFLPNGTTYLTYFDAAAKQIKFAVKLISGTWNLTLSDVTADAPGPVFCQHSLAIKNTTPAVAYTTQAGEVRYAEYTCIAHAGCSWASSSVSGTASFPESVSLKFNSLNKPRISFIQNLRPTLALNDGAGWSLSQIDVNAGSGQTSLAIDSNGKAHVAYFRNAPNALYYATQNGASPVTWNTPQLVDDDTAGTYVSLQLFGVFNLAYLAYTATDGASLRFRQQGLNFPDVVWESIQTVDGFPVESPSLTLESTGQARIFYYSGKDSHLHQALKQDSNWRLALLDSNAQVGRGLSLAISPITGKVALGCFDENVSGLKYLYELTSLYLPLLRK